VFLQAPDDVYRSPVPEVVVDSGTPTLDVKHLICLLGDRRAIVSGN
jgi:hypothetical protein